MKGKVEDDCEVALVVPIKVTMANKRARNRKQDGCMIKVVVS